MSLEERPAKKKWQKPVGIMLIILAYSLLATGVALACLSQLPKGVRIFAPIFGMALFSLSGAWGFVLCNRAELVYPLKELVEQSRTYKDGVSTYSNYACLVEIV